MAIFTPDEVLTLDAMRANGATVADMCAAFGCSPQKITHALQRRGAYADIPGGHVIKPRKVKAPRRLPQPRAPRRMLDTAQIVLIIITRGTVSAVGARYGVSAETVRRVRAGKGGYADAPALVERQRAIVEQAYMRAIARRRGKAA